jgi:hypothetical protein
LTGVTPQPDWEQRVNELFRDPEESGPSEEERYREFPAMLREYGDEITRSGVSRHEMEARALVLIEKRRRWEASTLETFEAMALLRIFAVDEISRGRTSDDDRLEFMDRWGAHRSGGVAIGFNVLAAWMVARDEVLGEPETPAV